MSTSPLIAQFKPTGSATISRGTLGYVRTRVRQWAYNLLVAEFKKSCVSQADLGKRLDKAPEIISRLLSRPGNWELDTFSAAIFALTGGLLTFGVRHQAQSALEIFPEIKLVPIETQTANTQPLVFAIAA
jgi:hypothetical protein